MLGANEEQFQKRPKDKGNLTDAEAAGGPKAMKVMKVAGPRAMKGNESHESHEEEDGRCDEASVESWDETVCETIVAKAKQGPKSNVGDEGRAQ